MTERVKEIGLVRWDIWFCTVGRLGLCGWKSVFIGSEIRFHRIGNPFSSGRKSGAPSTRFPLPAEGEGLSSGAGGSFLRRGGPLRLGPGVVLTGALGHTAAGTATAADTDVAVHVAHGENAGGNVLGYKKKRGLISLFHFYKGLAPPAHGGAGGTGFLINQFLSVHNIDSALARCGHAAALKVVDWGRARIGLKGGERCLHVAEVKGEAADALRGAFIN